MRHAARRDITKRIPRKGLRIDRQYANIGDKIKVFPMMKNEPPWEGKVTAIVKNKFGRISYKVARAKLTSEWVFTEELTQLRHEGLKAR